MYHQTEKKKKKREGDTTFSSSPLAPFECSGQWPREKIAKPPTRQ
jgi:hypothetical protein